MQMIRSTINQLMADARAKQNPSQAGQSHRLQTRYTYSEGPMVFLGQQVKRAMQDAGFPTKIVFAYRSPEYQARLYAKGRTSPGVRVTNARPYDSPHQWFEAVDLCHEHRGWDVSEEYWDTLAGCVRMVAAKFDCELEHGHGWRFRDSAHVELRDWRDAKERLLEFHNGELLKPTSAELWARFHQVLPKVARRYERDRMGAMPSGVDPLEFDSLRRNPHFSFLSKKT